MAKAIMGFLNSAKNAIAINVASNLLKADPADNSQVVKVGLIGVVNWIASRTSWAD